MRARHSGTRPAQIRLPRPARAPPRIRGSPTRQLIKQGPTASRLRCRDHTWLKTEGSVASRAGLTCGDVRVSEAGPQEAPRSAPTWGGRRGRWPRSRRPPASTGKLSAARPDRFRADLSGAASGRPLTINLVSRRRHRHILLATSSRPNRSVSAAHVPFQATSRRNLGLEDAVPPRTVTVWESIDSRHDQLDDSGHGSASICGPSGPGMPPGMPRIGPGDCDDGVGKQEA